MRPTATAVADRPTAPVQARRKCGRGRYVPHHHAAPALLQRRPAHRRGVPRGRAGDHEPHRMDDSDAKRIVDFAAGLVFGLRGTIERVTNKVFLLSPANVDVGAEARAQIAQDGFFNQS